MVWRRIVRSFCSTTLAFQARAESRPIQSQAWQKHVVTFIHALGLKQVDLLGFSLGGFVAQQVVLENADLIRRVVLAGTGPEGGEGMDSFTPKVAEHATRE